MITFFLSLGGLAILIFGLSRVSELGEGRRVRRSSFRPLIFSAERLTAIATTAAAIAAGAAVWAALRQERATFEANLYSRQIEIASDVSTTMERMRDRLGDLVLDAETANSRFNTDPEKVLGLAKNLVDEIQALSVNRTTTAHFIFPEDYDKAYSLFTTV